MWPRFALAIITAGVSVFGGAAASADDCPAALPASVEIDRIADSVVRMGGSPGLAIGIIQDGQVTYIRGHGVLRRDNPDKMVDCDTRFHVASLSKPVVATAMMTMFERGEVSQDETLADIVTDGKVSARLADLMTHTAGMRDWARANGRLTQRDRDEYFARMSRRARDARGGRGFRYSDLDYNLIGLVIERRTGVSFEEFMQSRILGPLGMAHSSFVYEPGKETSSAWPHIGSARLPAKSHPFDIAFAPSSGLQTSVRDLVLFMQAYLARAEVIMSRSSYDAAVEPRHETEWDGISQSLVWQIAQGPYGEIWQHGGTDKGFRALMTLYPEKKAGIVILANGEDLDRWALRTELEAIMFGDD